MRTEDFGTAGRTPITYSGIRQTPTDNSLGGGDCVVLLGASAYDAYRARTLMLVPRLRR
jgi:hypothetical protein